VLLDDRLVYAVGDSYQGSAREKFDRENPLELDAFAPWEIAGGLRNIETESPLRGAEKRIGLSAEAGHMFVNYLLPHGWRRLSAEICFSPDYHRLPQHGRDGPLAASTGGWLLSRSLLRPRLVMTCFAMRAPRRGSS
jgi:hypothetical protein